MEYEVIKNLYAAFGRYHLSDVFNWCDIHELTKEEKAVFDVELNQLTIPDLDTFSCKAMTTWGDVHDFKHFLPRLFELALEAPDEFTMLEVMFSKLPYGQWTRWPENEQQVIIEYLSAFWETTLKRTPNSIMDDTADTAICAIGNAQVAMMPYLNSWTAESRESAAIHLATFKTNNQNAWQEPGRLSNAFWGDCREQERTVVRWLKTFDVPLP